MSGGRFAMDYNQETTYFKAHCLEHDVVDIVKMMADCALEPRSVVAANVGISKNHDSHKLASKLNNG
jgi:processing peptidase subunit beta